MYTQRQRRCFSRIVSGLQRGGSVKTMVLTSSPASPADIHHSFRVLKERLRRRGEFEYLAVCEIGKGGMKHLHIVFRGQFVPQKLLSLWWSQIHSAPVVWISAVRGKRGIAGELCKYLVKEMFCRFWSSWYWIYRGWRIVWTFFWKQMSYVNGVGNFKQVLDGWRRHLEGKVVVVGGWVVKTPLVVMEERGYRRKGMLT